MLIFWFETRGNAVKNAMGSLLFMAGFLERKICNPLAYLADRLKKLRGSGQLYLPNVKIVLM